MNLSVELLNTTIKVRHKLFLYMICPNDGYDCFTAHTHTSNLLLCFLRATHIYTTIRQTYRLHVMSEIYCVNYCHLSFTSTTFTL